jgi:arylformamidase
MILNCEHKGRELRFDLGRATDISIPVRRGENSVEAFYIPPARMAAFRAGSFVGSVAEGGACNCENILFNAHGNGTHTECVGHVSREHHLMTETLSGYFFLCRLHTVDPRRQANGDYLIFPDQLEGKCDVPALAIRTLPNGKQKLDAKYSGSNPVYLHPDAATHIRLAGVEHLLVDLPSVDREEDGGALAAHKNYWNYPSGIRENASITEFIYVPDELEDGLYLLNLMVCSMESDAVPSRPVLYPRLEI